MTLFVKQLLKESREDTFISKKLYATILLGQF